MEPSTTEYRLARALHVWVSGSRGRESMDEPGLLLMWRQGERGWEAWVITASRGHPGGAGPSARMGWVTGDRIRPFHERRA